MAFAFDSIKNPFSGHEVGETFADEKTTHDFGEIDQTLITEAENGRWTPQAVQEDNAREELLDIFQGERQEEPPPSYKNGNEALSYLAQAELDLQRYQEQYQGMSMVELLAQYREGIRFERAIANHEGVNPLGPQDNESIGSSESGLGLLVDLLRIQQEHIRQEWESELTSGCQDQHDLEIYFAGKIDQHNGLIDQAVADNPKLQATLPPQINYEQLRTELQQQTQQQGQKIQAQAMGMAI